MRPPHGHVPTPRPATVLSPPTCNNLPESVQRGGQGQSPEGTTSSTRSHTHTHTQPLNPPAPQLDCFQSLFSERDDLFLSSSQTLSCFHLPVTNLHPPPSLVQSFSLLVLFPHLPHDLSQCPHSGRNNTPSTPSLLSVSSVLCKKCRTHTEVTCSWTTRGQ